MHTAIAQPSTSAQTLDISEGLRGDSATFLQLQITVRDSGGTPAAPAAGTLTIKAKAQHGGELIELQNSPVDLTLQDNWLVYIDRILAAELEFTPNGLTATYTYEVVVSMA